jgi:hypothetical protein
VARPKSEQKRRFALLKYAKDIIIDSRATISAHAKEFKRGRITFLVFKATREDEIIHVIFEQREGKQIYFLSIYSKKSSH